MHMFVVLHGQHRWVAALIPLLVDGMIVAASAQCSPVLRPVVSAKSCRWYRSLSRQRGESPVEAAATQRTFMPFRIRSTSPNRRLLRSRYALAVSNEFEILRDRLRDFADARGWGKSHSPRNLALALVGEVGELSAELQWVPDNEMSCHLWNPEARARLADEVADVLIYLIQFADVCGIDPLRESNAKIERNEERFPTH